MNTEQRSIKQGILILQLCLLLVCPILLGLAIDIQSWTLGIFAAFWLFFTLLTLTNVNQ